MTLRTVEREAELKEGNTWWQRKGLMSSLKEKEWTVVSFRLTSQDSLVMNKRPLLSSVLSSVLANYFLSRKGRMYCILFFHYKFVSLLKIVCLKAIEQDSILTEGNPFVSEGSHPSDILFAEEKSLSVAVSCFLSSAKRKREGNWMRK